MQIWILENKIYKTHKLNPNKYPVYNKSVRNLIMFEKSNKQVFIPNDLLRGGVIGGDHTCQTKHLDETNLVLVRIFSEINRSFKMSLFKLN